jgi:putative membrane protein
MMDWSKFGGQFLAAILYVLLGLVFFFLAFFVIDRLTPFSIRKEIEEDQNTSLAILIGSVIVGIAIIIAAAIHGS